MSNRKLQTQIDRVLKKVDDRTQAFDQIWDKFHDESNAAQREKHEGELKKEIKKLQRLRDQIKTWQGDSLIKDKIRLDANRKIIEERMEKFRICEQHTKIKAFSKKGLARDRTNPKQKAKETTQNWIQESIARLEKQSEELQAEMESMKSGKRRKREAEHPRITYLKQKVSRHEYHVKMLERVLRATHNDTISPEELVDLKDNVDYYVDFNQEPDFFEDEEMYEALNLTSAPSSVQASAQADSDTTSREQERDAKHDAAKDGANNRRSLVAKEYAFEPHPKGALLVSSTASTPNSRSGLTFPKSEREVSSTSTIIENSSSRNANYQPLSVTCGIHAGDASKELESTAPLFSTIVKGSNMMKQDQKEEPEADSSTDINGPQQVKLKLAHSGPQRTTGTLTVSQAQRLSTTRETAPDVHESEPAEYLAVSQPNMPEAPTQSRTPKMLQTEQNHTGCNIWTTPLTTSRNPAHVPECFPGVPASVLDVPETFDKFSADTLFFIFCHRQGTHQQYLAATELKKRGWRFHKKYLTWFHRIDESRRSTDEFEVGAFIYFDYVNVLDQNQGPSWCQRVKSDFVFEYCFLEDELE